MAAVRLFHLVILLSIFTICRSQAQDDVRCMYSMYVSTNSTLVRAGTNSTITLELYDWTGFGIRNKDLVRYGGNLMGRNHDYFEPGNVDMFAFTGPCLTGTLCAINITSDGRGPDDETGSALAQGWYLDFLEITTSGLHQTSRERTFTVQQWLAPHPYRQSAIRNTCGGQDSHILPANSKVVPV